MMIYDQRMEEADKNSMRRFTTGTDETGGEKLSGVYMVSFSGLERLHHILVSNGPPGYRSIAQSYSLCGGKDGALSLLKTCSRL